MRVPRKHQRLGPIVPAVTCASILGVQNVGAKRALLSRPDRPCIEIWGLIAQPVDKSPQCPDVANLSRPDQIVVPWYGEGKIDPDKRGLVVELDDVIDPLRPAPPSAACWSHKPTFSASHLNFGHLDSSVSGSFGPRPIDGDKALEAGHFRSLRSFAQYSSAFG